MFILYVISCMYIIIVNKVSEVRPPDFFNRAPFIFIQSRRLCFLMKNISLVIENPSKINTVRKSFDQSAVSRQTLLQSFIATVIITVLSS